MTAFVASVPPWAWLLCAAVAVAGAFLAADRSRALGHRVGDGWLVARSGSLDRRRDCIAAAGIIGWTVRQTLFQRRAGVATLIAATAAGVKGYRVLDVPAEQAWSVAAAASPWVADNDLGSLLSRVRVAPMRLPFTVGSMAIGGVLFDIDGVLVTSWQPIAGAAETLRVLADNQIARTYLTNTTTTHPRPDRRPAHRGRAWTSPPTR